MLYKKESQAPTKNEQPFEVFNFAETKTEIRSMVINGNPYFVGKDVAASLGYEEPHKAVRRHCRYVSKHPVPHPQSPEKQLDVLLIPESDLYRLIINSTLPSAEKFERWVMEEVLPSIRKKGSYKVASQQRDFIDARDIPYKTELINNYNVRIIFINEKLYSLNDLCKSLMASTGSDQLAKKLNVKRMLAQKVWIYGNTSPAWFTNELGKSLVFSGSRIERNNQQMLLPYKTEKGGAQ